MEIQPILDAFKGHKTSIAKAFNVSKPAVSRWVRNGKIPDLRAFQWREIERQRAELPPEQAV